MTQRCHHEFEMKMGYQDDIICQKCQRIWHISEYMNWTAKQLMHALLPAVRRKVLEQQVERFNAEAPK
jgi:hypothetical protein